MAEAEEVAEEEDSVAAAEEVAVEADLEGAAEAVAAAVEAVGPVLEEEEVVVEDAVADAQVEVVVLKEAKRW